MSLQGPTGCPHGARVAAARAADDEEAVELRYGGRRWGGLRRRHMRRVAGSLPERVFRRDSQLLGGATVERVAGGWVWHVADPNATPEAVHAAVRFLQTGRLSDAERTQPAVAALVSRWGLL